MAAWIVLFAFTTKSHAMDASGEVALSGTLRIKSSVDMDNSGSHENLTSFQGRTIIQADYHQFTLSGISDYLYFGPEDPSENYHFDIHEMVFRYLTGTMEIHIGKQIKRWGKTDQISPVDTLNPENITDFMLSSYEDRKIPVWMADVLFRHHDFFLEGVFIPFFEPSRFDYFGTDWAVFSHVKKDINDSSLPFFLKQYFNAMDVHETLPDSGTNSFEYAVRMGGTIDRFDFGFTYHRAVEDLPFFSGFPVKNLSLRTLSTIQPPVSSLNHLVLTNEKIETTYLGTHIFGFEFETTLSDFGIRGEAALKTRESFLTGSLTSVRNPSLFWIIGADYIGPNEWYFNLQLGHQHIFDYDPSILYFEDDNYSLSGEIKKRLIFDWLHASVQFTAMLNDDCYYLSPRLSYTRIRNLEGTLGLNIFEGDDDSLIGRYDENDQVFIELKYYF